KCLPKPGRDGMGGGVRCGRSSSAVDPETRCQYLEEIAIFQQLQVSSTGRVVGNDLRDHAVLQRLPTRVQRVRSLHTFLGYLVPTTPLVRTRACLGCSFREWAGST